MLLFISIKMNIWKRQIKCVFHHDRLLFILNFLKLRKYSNWRMESDVKWLWFCFTRSVSCPLNSAKTSFTACYTTRTNFATATTRVIRLFGYSTIKTKRSFNIDLGVDLLRHAHNQTSESHQNRENNKVSEDVHFLTPSSCSSNQ